MLLAAPLALAACSDEGPRERPPVGPAARITGPAESCIQLSSFSETRIRDDWTIDFMRNGRQGWRNTLPQRCSGLKSEGAFSHETSLAQLCNTDVIRILFRSGGGLQRGAACGLGQFVPIEIER
jgi:hypothetical protein